MGQEFLFLKTVFQDIKIQHSVFALPFALMSAFMAARGLPDWGTLALIVIAMVFARSSAMVFNRIVDREYDRQNPRTQKRPLATGGASVISYSIFVTVSSALFVFTCYWINELAFYCSPVVLAVVFLYSFTKRFTSFSHFFLGLALGLSPVGGWIAVTGTIELPPILLGIAVIFWLVGLDVIYSCQDYQHDVSSGLHSIPQRFGIAGALRISKISHGIMVFFLLSLPVYDPELTGYVYLAGVGLVGILLFYEHSIVREDDLSRVNVAFFNVNGLISTGLMVFTLIDCWVG